MHKFLLFIILLFFVSDVYSEDNYVPRFKKDWGVVEKHILNDWHTSLIDVSKLDWMKTRGIVPPHNFMGIAKGQPTLFYWDNYFTNKGLLLFDSLQIYAVNAVNNLLWEVDSIGFVPNANFYWGMTRSQPPYLAMMVDDVYRKTNNKKWLAHAYEILKKEYHFWTDTSSNAIENHTTSIVGLQRFYYHGSELELINLYKTCYDRNLLAVHPDSISLEEKLKIAGNYCAEAATGMDFTPRFENRCTDFVAVELNANLYKYEMLFSYFSKELGLKNESNWQRKAETRKKLINKYCWNKERGLFMDYDFVNNRFSSVASISCMSPLVVGMASKSQAKSTVRNLHIFEYEYGITVCEKTQTAKKYQWDYPAAWAPMYMLTAQGLSNYGYTDFARRICSKYLDLVTKNFVQPIPETYSKKGKQFKREKGCIYEKYDVVTGGINDLEYPANEFFGWSAGTFIWSLDLIQKN